MPVQSLHKKRVAILRGGVNDTHAFSMQQGAELKELLNALPQYEAVDVMVSRDGEWLLNGFVKTPGSVLAYCDGAIIALFGTYGEDGTVQRLLERHGVPYVGSRPFQSSLCLHKQLAKSQLQDKSVRMAPDRRVLSTEAADLHALAASIMDSHGQTYIIKPNTGGLGIDVRSGVGAVTLAKHLKDGREQGSDLLIEPHIQGRVVTCGVVEGLREQALYTTAVIEVLLDTDENFSIENHAEYLPARISRQAKREVEEVARVAHQSLGLRDYSRSDFIVTNHDEVYFLEANSLPSLVKSGPFLHCLSPYGVGEEELLGHLLAHATI